IFICLANLIDIVPGLSSPTAVLETTAALAVITFFSVHYVGIKSKGLLGYLKSFTEPNIILLPFTILSQITRTFSMMVRLFGNMMSGQFLMGIILAFVGLLVPIPLMILHVLISILQAYIFTILATVFIAAAIAEDNKGD
ncbi:MAG TPA: F0F1 ATP synthase subunit A, partial [Emcibacteraceae bacterium]|nr:F0F1 ATP synthase subunit A [Emcibacteraceae bacterium]